MQAPGGATEDATGGFALGGWAVPYFDEAVGQAMGEMFAKPFGLLLGRKTYDIFAAHWRFVGADDPTGARFDRSTKYVAARSPALSLPRQHTEVPVPGAGPAAAGSHA